MARSLGRLGTQRGVQGLIRYGYPQRNGKGHLAVALGQWRVSFNPGRNLTDASLEWISTLVRASNGKLAPASWKSAARRCDEALLATCRNGRDARTWEELLLAMGAAEALLAQTPKKAGEAFLHPLRNLPVEWLKALPPSPELRLAVALAGQVGVQEDERADYKQPVRIHFLPFEWDQNYKSWDTHAFAAHAGPAVVAISGNLLRDASALVRRRLHNGRFALCAGYCHYAPLADMAAFLRGEVDEARVLALARPLMALKWQDAPRLPFPDVTVDDKAVLALYGVLRLAHMPVPFEVRGTEYRVKTDPAIVQRLLGGDASAALTLAAHRLTAAGLRPYIRTAIADTAFAQRLAAALVFPIHPDSAACLADTLCHVTTASQPTHHEGVHA
jgi:CRISPR-associated protein Csx17